MTGTFPESADRRRVRAAVVALSELCAAVGAPGRAAAAACPGLLAQVDQHAAAVRDALGSGHQGPSMVALAGYAEGLRNAAVEAGWWPVAAHEIAWPRAPWLLLRLLAVCVLAEPTP